MLTITFLNLETHVTETENFADYSVFELFDSMCPVAVMKWSHFDEQGNNTSGGSGMNAGATLHISHGNVTEEQKEDFYYQMSANVD